MIQYEIVAIPASALERQMILSYLSQNDISSLKARTNYLGLLEACGWSEESFDQETLNRINYSW